MRMTTIHPEVHPVVQEQAGLASLTVQTLPREEAKDARAGAAGEEVGLLGSSFSRGGVHRCTGYFNVHHPGSVHLNVIAGRNLAV